MSLTVEQIAALLAPPKAAQGGAGPDWLVCTDYIRKPIETYECEGCGHCERPGKCAQSVECPVCFSPPKTLCTENNGSRVVGFHRERWTLAGGFYLDVAKQAEANLIARVLEKLSA